MPKTDDHDLEVKAKKARRFLMAGNKVKFNVRFRGREMAHPDIGRKMLEDIAEQLRDVALVEQRPLMEGRVLSLLLAPNAKVLKAAQDAQKAKLRDAQVAKSHAPASAELPTALDDDDDDELDDDDDELDDDDFEDDDDDDDDDEPKRRSR
jgi:translation initiation factor IF-3